MSLSKLVHIKCHTVGEAWLKAVSHIIENGHKIEDIVEVSGMIVSLDAGFIEDNIYQRFADKDIVKWMTNNNFGSSEPIEDWGYSYGQRLYSYRGVNQLDEVCRKLSNNSAAKSATISLGDPSSDFSGHMPCINVIDFKIRRGRLNLYCFFRSQDIGKKMCADMKSLGVIQETVAEKIGVNLGCISCYIVSAHVYTEDVPALTEALRAVEEI